MFRKKQIIIYSDGGSRGNPGPAAAGFIIYQNQNKILQGKKFLGICTNNAAEYQAIIIALESLIKHDILANSLICYLDSELVVMQIIGQYKIKKNHLYNYFLKIKQLVLKLKNIGFTNIVFETITIPNVTSIINQIFDVGISS